MLVWKTRIQQIINKEKRKSTKRAMYFQIFENQKILKGVSSRFQTILFKKNKLIKELLLRDKKVVKAFKIFQEDRENISKALEIAREELMLIGDEVFKRIGRIDKLLVQGNHSEKKDAKIYNLLRVKNDKIKKELENSYGSVLESGGILSSRRLLEQRKKTGV